MRQAHKGKEEAKTSAEINFLPKPLAITSITFLTPCFLFSSCHAKGQPGG